MGIYLISLFGACFFSMLAENGTGFRNDGHRQYKKWPITLLIVFLVVISGFRYMNYYESDEYVYRVEVASMVGKSLIQALLRSQEWLYNVIIWFCANVLRSEQSFIFLTALATNYSFIKFFQKHTNHLTFVVFMYIVGGTYFTTMNVTRQYLALAITIWAIDLAAERKLLKYVAFVLIAAGIHSSSMLMLPLYLIFRKNQWDRTSILIIIATGVVFTNFTSVITAVLSSDNPYSHYLEGFANSYGVKIIRILVWSIPYAILLLNRRTIMHLELASTQDMFCILFSLVFNILSYKYVFVARISGLFCAHTLCMMPVVPTALGRGTGRFVKIMMIVLFFLFGCYQMWGYQPYHNVLFENISGVLWLG